MTKALSMFGVMILVPVYLYAVDGQVLINQSTLNAAGGTYTITAAGSYKLSGNLIAKNQDTDVIAIATDHVTIDLNGFAILGIADCSGGFPCNGRGLGSGINIRSGPFFNITIRNGTIQGMGGVGISLNSDSVLVEYMHVRSNAFGGIFIGRASPQSSVIVQHNNVQLNGNDGIQVDSGNVSDNVVSQNGTNGIEVSNAAGLPTGTVARNVVTSNLGFGLKLFGSVNYIGNSLSGNLAGNVSGGFNQGQNLCGGAACPGAVF